jgi:hypothetical protein
MNIQIIISGDGWVLDKYGEILAQGTGAELRTTPNTNPHGITYLMNYAQGVKLASGHDFGKVVAMMTHREPNGGLVAVWNAACEFADWLVPMSITTERQIHMRFRNKATTIPLPVRSIFTHRAPRIGVAACRNPGNEYRKGWDLVDRLKADHPEWDIVMTGGNLSDAELVEWYRSIDIYLCASRYEGGPLGVLEAKAMGLVVVSPLNVGWCGAGNSDYQFTAGKYSGMELALQWAIGAVAPERVKNKVHHLRTEADYIRQHVELFNRLTNNGCTTTAPANTILP